MKKLLNCGIKLGAWKGNNFSFFTSPQDNNLQKIDEDNTLSFQSVQRTLPRNNKKGVIVYESKL